MRLLVTGSDGAIGRAIVRAAAERDAFELVLHRGRVDGDLLDREVVRDLVRRSRADVVVNAVGASYGEPQALWSANLLLPLRLVEVVSDLAPATRVVLVGSAAEYGLTEPGQTLSEDAPCRPNSTYGLSKLAAGQGALAACEDRVIVARLFNVVAPPLHPLSLLGRVAAGYESGDPEPAGAGEVRDFTPIDFVGRALVALAAASDPPAIVNVCTGVARTAADLLGRHTAQQARNWAVGDPSRLVATTGLDPQAAARDLDRILA